MGGRAAVLILGVAVGSGIGGWFARGVTNFRPPSAPAASDGEVVLKLRVRSPDETPGENPRAARSSTIPQGALVQTCNPFDLAIEGDGFFQICTPSGETAYTRVGVFGRAADGSLVTSNGFLLQPEVRIPSEATTISVGSDGTVSYVRANALNVYCVAGQLTLARFRNPGWLKPIPGGLLGETAESGEPWFATPGASTFGLIRQGFRERHSDQLAATIIDLVHQLGQQSVDEGNPGWRVWPAGGR